MKNVCIEFLYQNEVHDQQEPEHSFKVKTPDTVGSAKAFTQFFASDDEFEITSNIESKLYKRDKEIDTEILHYSTLLADQNVLKSNKPTSIFWQEHRKEMPKLFELSIILLNISSTSAFIERFFSISGIVSENRRASMTEELIEMRSMLKANMSILSALTKII